MIHALLAVHMNSMPVNATEELHMVELYSSKISVVIAIKTLIIKNCVYRIFLDKGGYRICCSQKLLLNAFFNDLNKRV